MTSKCIGFAELALLGFLSSGCAIAGETRTSAPEAPAQPQVEAARAAANAPESDVSQASLQAGAKLYHQFCAGCHGPTAKGGKSGEGLAKVPPSLVDEQWTYGSSDGAIFRAIKMGTPPDYAMVPWEGVISDDDIWNIVHYLRSLRTSAAAK